MKFLITNDDGIDAPGLAALAAAARPLGEVVIAAPALPLSGCSHQVTTGTVLRIERREAGYAVLGTPADCVRLALHDLAPDVDWVLSGINAGGNLGADVYHSGTVAAVREAVLHGRPGIAFSHYLRRGLPVDWQRAARWVAGLIPELLARPLQPGRLWNVNLPHLEPGQPEPPAVACPLQAGPLPLAFRQDGEGWRYCGSYHDRCRDNGSDVAVCFGGGIAVTAIDLP